MRKPKTGKWLSDLRALAEARSKAAQGEWAWNRTSVDTTRDYLLANGRTEMVLSDNAISHTGAFGKRRKAARKFICAAANLYIPDLIALIQALERNAVLVDALVRIRRCHRCDQSQDSIVLDNIFAEPEVAAALAKADKFLSEGATDAE